MTNLSAVTATDVAPVQILEQFSGPAAESITAGQVVRRDTSNGKVTPSNATTSAEARSAGIALQSAAAGESLEVIRKGLVDLGNILGDLDYDADVYLSDTDGRLADAAGSVEKIVGTVEPVFAHTTADKVLRVDL